MLRNGVECPTADMLRRDLNNEAIAAKLQLSIEFAKQSKVSIALDAWTSPNRISFLAIIAYYITSDFIYKNALIGFEEIHGLHTGENMASMVRKCLQEYNVDKLLFAVTTDNAGNNYTLSKHLQDQISQTKEYFWDREVMHIPCLAHVVQLAVKAFLDGIKASAENDEVVRQFNNAEINKVIRMEGGFNKTLSKVRFTPFLIC